MAAGKRPGEVLGEILKERGISTSAFGEAMGGDYLLARRWILGGGFDKNPKNQGRAEAHLKLPKGHFAKVQAAIDAETLRKRVFAKFESTWRGRPLTEEERATLWSWRFYGQLKPTVLFYQLQVGVLRDQVPLSTVQHVIDLNERADNELAEQPDFPDVSEVLDEEVPTSDEDEPHSKPKNDRGKKPTKKPTKPRRK